MGNDSASLPVADVAANGQHAHTARSDRRVASKDGPDVGYGPDRAAVIRARQQVFGFTLFGLLSCVATLVFSRWSPQADPGRWFWACVGSVGAGACLFRANQVHGGVGADRDASPYYGIFAGVVSGALLLLVFAVEGWIVSGVFFVMAVVLAFMAWIEQSAIGMTAAVCVAVLCAGSGFAVLDGTAAVGFGSLALGLMLLAGGAASAVIRDPAS